MGLMVTYIAGMNYRPGSKERLAKLLPGEALRLIRDGGNSFDKNAVAVYDGDMQLGFVPAIDAITVAKVLDTGIEVGAYLSSTPEQTNRVSIHWRRLDNDGA